MASTTFTLREAGINAGEYVQYNSEVNEQFSDSSFFLEIKPTDYEKLYVSWEAPTFDVGTVLLPVDVTVRWSLTGEPQTIEEGFPFYSFDSNGQLEVDSNNDAIILSNGASSEYFTYDFTKDLSASVSNYNVQGKWVYVSLFLRHASTNTDTYTEVDQYYEKIASLSTLMPYNYGSVEDLWERIPLFLRTQDTNNDLYNYLQIFGWDLDYVRTIIDYLMVQRDPQLASSYALENMMKELGTLITTIELGASRARNYLQDVISLRMSKGTEDGIKRVLQAITGCRVDIDVPTKSIVVHPQRTNWLRDPRVAVGMGTTGWYGYTSSSASVSPVYEYLTFGPSNASVNLYFSTDRLAFNPVTSLKNNGASVATAYIYGKFLVPFNSSDTLYFSVQPTTDPVYANRIKATDISAVYMCTSSGVIASSVNTFINTANGLEYFALDMSGTSSTEGYIALKINIASGQTIQIGHMLLENGYIGTYFDGNTNIGGWLRGYESKSDYHWHDAPSLGTPALYEKYETFATYSADTWRTQQTILTIYKNVLPVTCLDYQLEFDWLPPYRYDPYSYTLPVSFV